jgi:hypothetical protein
MIIKTFKIIDDEGLGVRIFHSKYDAKQFIESRPEMKIVTLVRDTYKEALEKVGECLF